MSRLRQQLTSMSFFVLLAAAYILRNSEAPVVICEEALDNEVAAETYHDPVALLQVSKSLEKVMTSKPADQKPLPRTTPIAEKFHLQAISNGTAEELVVGLADSGVLLESSSVHASKLVQESARNAAIHGAMLLHKAQAIVDPDHIQAPRGVLRTQAHHHVANYIHQRRTPHQRPEFRVVDSFAGYKSILQDERVVLTVVCFGLIFWSSFMNLHRQVTHKGKMSSAEHCDHGLPSSEKKLSAWDGTITSFSSILGMGLLSLPYCLSISGMIGAPIVFILTACTWYTAHLTACAFNSEMQRVQKLTGVMPTNLSWGSLVGVAFGPKAGNAVNIFLVVELWGYLMSGVVATGMNLNQIVDEVSVSSAIAISVLGLYVLTSVPVRLLSQINSIANIFFAIVCGMFIVTGFLLPTKAPASDIKYAKPHGLLAAAGIMIFCPAAHSLFPSIMQRMEEPQKYPQCLRRSYCAAGFIYVVFAVMGYYLFGNATQASAVKNIGLDLQLVPIPNLGWMNALAALGMVVKLFATQPLIIHPLTSTVEALLQGSINDSVSKIVVPPMILALTAVVSMHFANAMTSLMDVVGSVFCMNICFVIPVLTYWKLSQGEVSFFQKVIFTGLIVMGLTFAVLGLIFALDI